LTNYADEEKEPQVSWLLEGGAAQWWRSGATHQEPTDGVPEGQTAAPSATGTGWSYV